LGGILGFGPILYGVLKRGGGFFVLIRGDGHSSYKERGIIKSKPVENFGAGPIAFKNALFYASTT
jgi:hypothetical protein